MKIKIEKFRRKMDKKFGINFNTKISDWYDHKLNEKNTIPLNRKKLIKNLFF